MVRSLVIASVLVACTRNAPPARSSPPRAPEEQTAAATPVVPATATVPAELSFAFLPPDLRSRGAELVDIKCPASTTRVETKSYGQTHRHCETASGTYEGPIVEFSKEMIRLRGTHDGLRAGIEIAANAGGVVESEFAAGHPVGHYRYRRGNVTVAEGTFDAEGRLDGEWIFRMPVSGQELTRTTMVHGTGSIELWDWRYTPKVTARLQCKDGLLDGRQMFHVLSSPETYEHRVDGEYRGGLPDGEWSLTRITDDVVLAHGRFKAGTPTGTWHKIAVRPCIGVVHSGDHVRCVYGKDLPYTCKGSKCAFDTKPRLATHSRAEEVEQSDRDLSPTPAELRPRSCELGAPYF
jgi:hypothetical protein